MAAGGWVSLLNWSNPEQGTTGSAYASSATLTDVCPPNRALPANSLSTGQILRVSAGGIYSTTGTPTLLLGVYYGGVAGTALAATAATTTGSGVANQFWELNAMGRVMATGNTSTSLQIATSGTVLGIGATTTTPVWMPATSSTGNTVSSLDPTTNKTISIGAQWGTSNASNTLTCYWFTLEAMN
jgi:hypothetical protein